MKKLMYSSVFVLSLFSFIACDKDIIESVEPANLVETEGSFLDQLETNHTKSELSITRASSIDGRYEINECDGGFGYGFFTVSTVNGRVQARGQFDFVSFTIYGSVNSTGNYVFDWQDSNNFVDPRLGKALQVGLYISADRSVTRGWVRSIGNNGEIEITRRYCE
ncbi:hypothetical protein ATO12_04655 [Aquimarina atlantica]|uniref:Uncharacterized protein n=1 Tax=Aquimarina atlantica TaxID=1317122 RepID=A0A023BPC8_9FLAO|nr:hypothetical protein [Aquimarina atlantica]EZH71912.1 hypothetical protein ATO12_04655 [Aquimarina atlantica]